MSRFVAAVLFLLAIAAAPPARAQAAADAAVALRSDPLYEAPDAEQVDRAAILEAIDEAATTGLDVRVAVLAAGDAEALAVEIADSLPGTTVVVFTASSYGVASGEVAQSRLSDALDAAADDLGGTDAAAGVAALVDALDSDGGPSLGLIVIGAVGVLLVVGVAGRVWDTRTRERRQARRRDRRRAELRERAREVGSRVVDLSDRVELAESPEASSSYAEAAEIFDGAERRIAGAQSMDDLDAVAGDLGRAGDLLDRVDSQVRG